VIETVFEQAGSDGRLVSVIPGARIDDARRAFHRNDRVLLKLHGDATDRTHRVLTLEDYEARYGGSQPLKALFEFTLARRLLFLGCSLLTDRTVQVLRETAARHPDYVDHFAILEQPDNTSRMEAREQTLAGIGIRPIWFPTGEFSSIEPLLNGILDRARRAVVARPAAERNASPSVAEVGAFLRDIEERFERTRVFHTRSELRLSGHYIPIDVTVERSHNRQTETTVGTETAGETAWSDRQLGDEFEADRVSWDAVRQRYGRLVVLGDPGMGKTTLVRMEAVRRAREQRERLEARETTPDDVVVPLLLRLPELARFDGEILDAAIAFVRRDYPLTAAPVAPWISDKLRGGTCILLLDGLDETPLELRNRLSENLNDRFGRNYPCSIVCTSRVIGYTSGFLAGAREVEIRPFRDEQSRHFVRAWFGLTARSEAEASQKSAGVLRELDGKPQLAGLARNPLLLSLICSLHEHDRLAFPSRRGKVYGAALGCMLNEWRATRRPQSPATIQAKVRLLEQLAWRFSNLGKDVFSGAELFDALAESAAAGPQSSAAELMREFTEEDGVIQQLTRGGEAYIFIHRSFQEYLAAGYLKRAIEKDEDAGLRMVEERFWSADWHETLALTAGRLPHPEPFIQTILNARDDPFFTLLVLAGSALGECDDNRGPVFRAAFERLYGLWKRFPTVPFVVAAVTAAGQSQSAMVELLAGWDTASAHEVLARIGTPRALAVLRACSSPDQVAAAAIARAGASDPGAIPDLIALVRANDFRSGEAAQLLGELGAVEAAPDLVDMLLAPDGRSRRDAAEALSRLRNPRIAEALLPLLSTPPVEPYVVRVIAGLRDPRAVPALIQLMRSPEEPGYFKRSVNSLAAAALGEIGGEAAVEALAAALGHESPDLRERSAVALARAKCAASVDALVGALEHPDAEVRGQATAGLIECAGRQAMTALKSAASPGAGDLETRAARALAAAGIADVVRCLSRALESADIFHRWDAWLALTEVSGVGDPAGILVTEAYYVRTPVARALAELHSEAATEALIHAAANEDGFVSTAAIHYLGRAATPKAADALIRIMIEGKSFYWTDAAKALGRLGDKRAAEPLFNRIAEHDYWDTDAVRALERILTDSVAEKVLQLPPAALQTWSRLPLARAAALRAYKSQRIGLRPRAAPSAAAVKKQPDR
jgi:HEAT repeat protein/MoxR-like ATPase